MTGRQQKFCEAYVISRNPQKASLEAGYSKTYSSTKSYSLLKKVEIKELISTLTEDHYKSHFEELGLKAIKTLSDVLENPEAPSTQLNSIKYILGVLGVGDVEDDSGTVHIKVTLPKELE